jgi:hypothetical protein
MSRQKQLDQAIKNTRIFTGILLAYSMIQAALYTVQTVHSPCPLLTGLLAAASTTYYIQLLLCLMVVTCIKKRACYWCYIVIGIFLMVFKFIMLMVIAVQARQTADSQPDCYIDRATLTFMLAAIILETAVLGVLVVVLRRLRKSKVLGLHNHIGTPQGKRFVDDYDDSEG